VKIFATDNLIIWQIFLNITKNKIIKKDQTLFKFSWEKVFSLL